MCTPYCQLLKRRNSNMKWNRILALGMGAALCVSLLAACGSDNDPSGSVSGEDGFPEMNISLAHSAATSHAHNTAAEKFAEIVSEKTGGKVTVTVYPASELGDQPALIESCYTDGDVDMVIASQSNMATYMPKLNALAAPFLFDSYEHAHKVMDDYVLDWINEDVGEQMNMHALAMFDYGFRHVTTNNIEVNSAADLEGVKIRVPGSAGLLATFDALGCNTQTIAYSELYQSLKQGVVDAEENPVATILADSYYECQNQLALTGHFFDVQALLINQSLWESMSPELQQVIQEAALEAQQVTRDLIAGGEEADIETLKSKGMNVTTPDKQSFVDKMGPAYEEIASLCGQDELDNLMAAVEAARESA